MTILVFLLLALAGVPLYAVIGGTTLLAFHRAGIDTMAVIIEMARLADTPMLTALPLFIFAGLVLAASNCPVRLLAVCRVLLHRLPGALALVTVTLASLFTALTGATGVTLVTVGPILQPALEGDGYDADTTLGLLTSASSLGLLLPPSLPLILYGVVSEIPIDELFRAGLLPGLAMILCLGAAGAWRGRRRSPPGTTAAAPPPLGPTLKAALPELLLPVLLYSGIAGGFMVVGEAAAITALYTVVVETWIKREVPVRRLAAIAAQAATLFGAILVILAAALASTSFLVDQQVPQRLFAWLAGWISNKWMFLAVLNLFLLMVGAVLDVFSAIILVVPIIVPVARAYGIDLIHLGVIFLTNLQIGYCTPPVGLNLFLASYQFKTPLLRTSRATLPYTLVLLLLLGIVTWGWGAVVP